MGIPQVDLQKTLVELIVLVLLVLAAWYGIHTVLGWRTAALANAATAKSLSTTAQSTSTIAHGVDATQKEAQRVDVVVTQQRATFSQQYEALQHADPVVRDWSDAPIPDSVRHLARARRCARDRSAGIGAGSPPDGASPLARWRHSAPGPSEQRQGADGCSDGP